MNRQILEKPFSPEQIKQREGNFGEKLDYIEGHAVIQRLNDAFDADWSFAIIQHETLKGTDEVIVQGELKPAMWSKCSSVRVGLPVPGRVMISFHLQVISKPPPPMP